MVNLEKKAKWVRQQILEMCVSAEGVHVASSLSCVEILVALYYGGILKFDPTNPKWEGRDYFIMSKGHGVIALYPILADLGFFPKEELSKLCQPDGILGSHADGSVPCIELTTGSLGHGLGVGTGLALAFKMDNKPNRVFVLLGDGECYEGAVWEAAMFAGHHELNNLVAIVDRNELTTIDFTEHYLKLDHFPGKWKAFGWNVEIADGHSFESLLRAFNTQTFHRPMAIIAKTVKGKGVSFMENNPMAHTFIPQGEMLEKAKGELSANTA